MRRVYILLFCILLAGFIAKPCFSEKGEVLWVDGYTWGSWADSIKFGWVVGFSSGVDQATLEGKSFLLAGDFILGLAPEETKIQLKERRLKLINLFAKALDLSGITFGQMVAGLDKFYKNYRNKEVLTEEAIWIVKLEVKGAPQEFIEQEIRLLRLLPAERTVKYLTLLKEDQAYKEACEKWGDQIPHAYMLGGK